MDRPAPTIKGIFVLSHIRVLEEKKGDDGIVQLLARYGKPIRFGLMENVPVREEVAIIAHVLDILSEDRIPREKRAFEAGKLHFENFTRTELGRLLLPIFRTYVKGFFMSANHIAGHVFQGVHFRSEDLGPASVRVGMENIDYPLDHFAGFFESVLEYGGVKGRVAAKDLGERRYQYHIEWEAR